MQQSGTAKLVDHLFRHEGGKMVAVLTKLLGFRNLDTAHDIMQDTLLAAMAAWRYRGVPDDPAAWLYRVARNKAFDFLRRETTGRKVFADASNRVPLETRADIDQFFLPHEIHDSVLRMMFACCHPRIPEESQISLALKTLGGMTTQEIAHAFLTSEDTISKRIYRAREKIRSEGISLEVPVSSALVSRLQVVLRVLYLLFNEGYNSSHPDQLIRRELCAEAMRLCVLLTRHNLTSKPETNALMALMCFQASRLDSRTDAAGNIKTLKYQDRSSWNRSLIGKGYHFLEIASDPAVVSAYHFEAAIASIHAVAPDFERTDWKSIYHLYEALFAFNPSPVVALNKAIASSYAIGAENALDELHRIRGLEKNHIYYASLGEIYLSLKKCPEARENFASAVTFAPSNSEKQFLREKLAACDELLSRSP